MAAFLPPSSSSFLRCSRPSLSTLSHCNQHEHTEWYTYAGVLKHWELLFGPFIRKVHTLTWIWPVEFYIHKARSDCGQESACMAVSWEVNLHHTSLQTLSHLCYSLCSKFQQQYYGRQLEQQSFIGYCAFLCSPSKLASSIGLHMYWRGGLVVQTWAQILIDCY